MPRSYHPFVGKSLIAVLSCLFPICSSALAHDKPNIVMIFADDLGTGDLGCYGHPYAQTPNVDRLAEEGTRFTRYYATGVTCCPSRTGFMTSRHPASFEKYMAEYGFGDRITVTELLHENGYATGHFGKWHIGPEEDLSHEIYGLDEVDVIGNSGNPESGRDDDLFAAAIGFIQRHRDRPFYVNIWGHISHYPVGTHQQCDAHFENLVVDEALFDPYMRTKFENTRNWGFEVDTCLGTYLADVRALDLAVGRVLDTLDDLQLSEDTIVVFSSDQGPAPNGEFQNERQRAADPIFKANMLGWANGLRGGKHEQYEGGVRIPFLLRWPGRVPENRVNSSSVLSGLDWLPTLCSLTSTPYEKSEFEGRDVSDIWLGAGDNPRRHLFWKAGGSPSALADPWKIHLKDGEVELYNLDEDPGETMNLAIRFPEVAERMTNAVNEWTQSLPTKVKKK